MDSKSDHRDLDKARRALRAALDQLDWSPSKLASQSGLHQTTITRFLGNPNRQTEVKRGLGLGAAQKIDLALASEKVDDDIRRTFREATGTKAFTNLPLRDDVHGVETSQILHMEMPLHVLVEAGVLLELRDRPSEAVPILGYLVHPDGKGILIDALKRTRDPAYRIMAAVASGYLGHAALNTGSTRLSDACLRQAIDLLADGEFDVPQHRLRAWERWREITGLTLKDFELWCVQMVGVTKRMIGGKINIDEAVGRFLYVVRDAKHAQNPTHVRANTLRDLAVVKLAVNPTSPEAGVHLNESVALLADTPDFAMHAMSLLRRAQRHKSNNNLSAMELDVIEGLALCPDDNSVVRPNALNTVAELYTDIEPSLAKRIALEALRRCEERNYDGQRKRAEELARKSPRSS